LKNPDSINNLVEYFILKQDFEMMTDVFQFIKDENIKYKN
jgi:hypothetical protein